MGIKNLFKSKKSENTTLEVGADVEYLQKDKWRKGVIHGVRSYDVNKKPVITYLVDTGKNEHVDEIITPDGEDNVTVRQPKQVEVSPDQIRPVK